MALEKLLFDLAAAVLMEGSHANKECSGKMSGSSARKPEPLEGQGGQEGPWALIRLPENQSTFLLFCSLSSGRSASAQHGTHSSHVTLPAPLRGWRAALRTPPPPAEPGQGEGSEFGGARVQVGAATRGWNQTGAEGPQGRRATWKSHVGEGWRRAVGISV